MVVDIVQNMIDAGIQKVAGQNLDAVISFNCADFLLFETDKKFDAIVSVEAIHHIKNTNTLLQKCFNLLKPGGKVCASVYIAYFRPKWLLDQYLLLTVGDKDLPAIQQYRTAADLAGFHDIIYMDVSKHVLPGSSKVLRKEPYWSKIKEYHKIYYGKTANRFLPLFLKIHDRVLRKNQLQLYFMNYSKPI